MFKLTKHNSIDFLKLYRKKHSISGKVFSIFKIGRKKRVNQTLKTVSYTILACLVIMVLYLSVNFVKIKSIYHYTMAGKSQMETAVELVKKQDFKNAIAYANLADGNFVKSLKEIRSMKSNFFISHTPGIVSQFNNIEYLVSSGEILSKAVVEGCAFADQLQSLREGDKKLSYSKYTAEEKKKLLKKIYESGPELVSMRASIDLALINLDKINYTGPFLSLQEKILGLKSKIVSARDLIDKSIPMAQLLPRIAGYPQDSTYLFLLQNNEELRPTGGFIGTYGILNVANGDITRFDTHDIYHMDMPVKDVVSVEPPAELKKYLGVPKWYMRDANWSPDWPTAAKKVEWFYDQENKKLQGKNQINNYDKQFNGVIGVTPRFIKDLLKMVGPITIEGTEYNDKNFTNLLEYRVERGYTKLGVSKWQRKEVIGSIARELKIRLLDLPSDRWEEVLGIMQKNFASHDILVYMNDQNLNKLVQDQGWNGEIKNPEGDYVMAVDANMAAFKTDAVVSRSIEYSVVPTNGNMIAKLRINYSHQGGMDWRTTTYRSYTRVYVPAGASLIKAEGNTEDNIAVKDEFGKTYFGAFITIEPGQIGSLYFEYKLPAKISEQIKNGKYSLYMQKQPGKNIDTMDVNLGFIDNIKSYNPIGFYVNKSSNNIHWQTNLNVDRKFEVNF